MFKFNLYGLLISLVIAFAFIACEENKEQEMPPTETDTTSVEMNGMEIEKAVAVLHPTEGNNVKGVVTFTKVDNGFKVVADLEGLTPGKHGFHIHEFGDCTAPDGTSAGGHFNPEGEPHSGPDSDKRHIGDLGNIEADENGKAHLEYVDTQITCSGKNSIIGHAVIVHEKEDDLTSQPTGAAGPRVACGVIGIAQH